MTPSSDILSLLGVMGLCVNKYTPDKYMAIGGGKSRKSRGGHHHTSAAEQNVPWLRKDPGPFRQTLCTNNVLTSVNLQ